MNLKYKFGGVVASAALMLTLWAPKAFADTTLEISGNGEGSTNTIAVSSTENCEVHQKANTEVLAEVYTSASTGGNEASGNTGGNVTIDTGNATATSTVAVTGGLNTAVNPCCCQGPCPDVITESSNSNSAIISGNGHDSTNTVVASKSKSSKVKQKANTGVLAGVRTKAKTGKNKANSNTGPGSVLVDTGIANSTSDVLVTGGTNDLVNP